MTAHIKLYPGGSQFDALQETLYESNACCNWVSEWAFAQQVFDPYKINAQVYRYVRLTFPRLNAQMVSLCIRKVAHAYARTQEQQIQFRPEGAIALDRRLVSFHTHDRQISVWTVHGRFKMPYGSGPVQDALLVNQDGESDLVWRNGHFYLAAHCLVEAPPVEPVDEVLACDLGIDIVLADSDGRRYSGAPIRRIRQRSKRRRGRLQAKGTRAARRRLKRLSGREARFMRDVNHCISKQIVAIAKDTKRAIALEDLTGIRLRTTVGRVMRGLLHDWAYYQLRVFIEYKARRAGVRVVIVSAAYSSTECARCGHVSKANRRSRRIFLCRQCWFKAHADENATWVLRSRGRAVIQRPDVKAA